MNVCSSVLSRFPSVEKVLWQDVPVEEVGDLHMPGGAMDLTQCPAVHTLQHRWNAERHSLDARCSPSAGPRRRPARVDQENDAISLTTSSTRTGEHLP